MSDFLERARPRAQQCSKIGAAPEDGRAPFTIWVSPPPWLNFFSCLAWAKSCRQIKATR
jgi:hypothetical protein